MRNIKLVLIAVTALITVGIFMGYASLINEMKFPIDDGIKMYIFAVIIGGIVFAMIPLILSIKNNKIRNKKINISNLKEDIKFEETYNKIREKYEYNLNKIRKKIRPITLVTILFAIIVGGFFGWMMFAKMNIEKYSEFIVSNELLIKTLPIASVLLFFVAFFFYSFKLSDYEKEYKNGVVADIVKSVNSGLAYSRRYENFGESPIELYTRASFDTNYFNSSKMEDFINGKLTDKLTVAIEELKLRHIIKRGKNRKSIDVFNGLFIHVQGIDKFNGIIKILNNNNKISGISKQDLTEVKMDSSEFERTFNVYANDPVTAMRILTSDIMQKMVEFETRLGIHYEVVICGSEIFMRFFTTELFEPAIFNESKEKDRVRAYYEIINLITDISIELDKTIVEIP